MLHRFAWTPTKVNGIDSRCDAAQHWTTMLGMARLLIFWTRPAHLSASDADDWVRSELRKVTDLTGVERAELIRLRSGSEHVNAPHDWMLDLHLFPGASPAECIEAQACAEWLGDLRLLGMRPAIVVADGEVSL
jgi:hypothetical protein